MAEKIHAYTGEDDGLMRLEPAQEETILRTIEEFTEGTMGALWGSDMDTGKTVQACEVMVRMGFTYGLFIGVKDTYDDINERLELQSDGTMHLRRIDGTKAGKQALADFRAGVDGMYFTGSQFLTAQDWTYRQTTETVTVDGVDTEQLAWKRDKKTEQWLWKSTEYRGPLEERQPVNERVHLQTYKKMKRKLDVIVFDEIHAIANRKAIGRRTLLTIKTERRLGMSGTWTGNKFENAWSISKWVWPNEIPGSFHAWKNDWCETGMVVVGKDSRGNVEEKERITGELSPGAFVASLPCYIRLESPTGPVPAPVVVHVDLSPKQREQYADLERDLMTWIMSKQAQGIMPLVTELPITLRMRLRTAALGELSYDEDGELAFAMDAQSSKLQAMRGIIDFWKGEQVAIYTHSKRFAKVVVARMQAAGYRVAEYSGDISSQKRKEFKAAFLAGEIDYVVAVIGAFNAGLDGFQRACSRVIWLSEDENNVSNNQAIKRFWRRGHGDFQHVKIIARDTHDEGIFNSLISQTLNMNASLRTQQIGAAA